tara:strand:- start:651 stop:797 length:147 start_codon:yes stop_codon:yes gene_type:complete
MPTATDSTPAASFGALHVQDIPRFAMRITSFVKRPNKSIKKFGLETFL